MKKVNQRKFAVGLFVFYILMLIWIILFKMQMPGEELNHFRSINLIPFRASVVVNGKIQISELFLNMAAFVPMGIYVSVICRKWSGWRKLAFCFGASLLIEVLQYVLAVGRTDITDLINNGIGGGLGILFYMGLAKVCRDSETADRIVNVFAMAGTVGASCLLGMLLWCNR